MKYVLANFTLPLILEFCAFYHCRHYILRKKKNVSNVTKGVPKKLIQRHLSDKVFFFISLPEVNVD